MEQFYLVCAVLGGTLLLCQFVMGLLGFGGHHELGGDHDMGADHDMGGHDAHHDAGQDHEHSWLVGVLTFRTLVAALTFFGLGGYLAMTHEDLNTPALSLGIALSAGGGALFLVAWLMRSLARLQAEGTVRIDRSVGKTGTVYLPVPGEKAGVGKVHLNLQNRTVEYQAVTAKDQIPTGSKVVVVGVISPDTVEVAPAADSGRMSHV
jgi:hypothetical protein